MASVLNAAVSETAVTLVSLCEFRLRATETVPGDADEGYEPLASVIREVGRELAADGALVAWHVDGDEPSFLFANGVCEPQSQAEASMVEAARTAAAATDLPPVSWAISEFVDVTSLLTTRIPTPGGIITVTILFKRAGAAARIELRSVAMRMLPMVQGFFRLWSLRSRAVATNRGLAAALNSGDVATMLVDGAGVLVFANAAAERLMLRNDGLRRAGASFAATRLADTMRLHASIEHMANGGERATSPAPVIALNRRNGRPLLAAIVPIDGTPPIGDAAAIVHVFDPDQDLEALFVPVCRLYELSPSEGRLAALLAGGITLADAAKAMRVQEQTVRSYLKQVFLKTDTNRQAELVWLMLKSAVRTTPGLMTRFM